LTAAVESFQKKMPLEVPLVVGGKEVWTTSLYLSNTKVWGHV
jgi:hypothetical protein